MFLNKELADEIALELINVVPIYYALMDYDSTILSCTDEKRVGTKHDGVKVLQEKEYDSLSINFDGQYPGCTQGVIFTITASNKTIGYIGISGVPEEIKQYGQIFRKTTELLLKEKFNSFRQIKAIDQNFTLVNSLIEGNIENYNYIKTEMLNYSINISDNLSVALLSVQEKTDLVSISLKEDDWSLINRHIFDFLSVEGLLSSKTEGSNWVIVSHNKIETLRLVITQMFNHLDIYFKNLNYHASVSCASDYEKIPTAYLEAKSTMSYLISKKLYGIYPYNPMDSDFYLNLIPRNHRINLKNKVFKDCDINDIEFFSEFIVSYFKHNGSIKQLAEQYFVHKNTIQYRIKLLKETTGLDIRDNSDLLILYLSIT